MAKESIDPDFLKKYGLNEKESSTIFKYPKLQNDIFEKYKSFNNAEQRFYLKRFKDIGYQVDEGTKEQRRDIIREIIQENEKRIQEQENDSYSDSESDSADIFLKPNTNNNKEDITNNEKEIEELRDRTLHPEKYRKPKEDKDSQVKKPESSQRGRKDINGPVTKTSTTPSSAEPQKRYQPRENRIPQRGHRPYNRRAENRSEKVQSQPIPESSKQKEGQQQKSKFHNKQAAFSALNEPNYTNTNTDKPYKISRNNYNQNSRNNYNQNYRNNYNQYPRNNYNQYPTNKTSQPTIPRPTLTDAQRRILYYLSGKVQDDDSFFNDSNYSLQKVLTSEPVDVNGERLPMNVPFDLGILFIQIFSKDITPEQRVNYQLTKTELITVQIPGDVIIQFEPIKPEGDQPAKIQFTFFSSPTLPMNSIKNIVETGLNTIAFSEWHEFKVTNVDYLTNFTNNEIVDLAAQYHTVIRIIDEKIDRELETRSITFRVLKLCLYENELNELVGKIKEWFDNARLCKCKNCYCIYPHIDTNGECRFRGHVGEQIPFDDTGNMEEIEIDDEGEEFIMVNYTCCGEVPKDDPGCANTETKFEQHDEDTHYKSDSKIEESDIPVYQ